MKTFRVIFTLVMFVTLLAACSKAPVDVGVGTEAPQGTEAPVVVDTAAPVENNYDSTAPITVWVDDVRMAGIELFKEKNPDVADLIIAEIQDRNTLTTKVLLWNNINEGWPDVVFAEPDIVQKISDPAHDYAMDLTPWVTQEVVDGYTPGALAPCVREGELICLRADIAPNVLWYNALLMEEFGYAVPTTWEEYLAIGLQVAKDHPGYVIGACGDGQCTNAYFWPSQCPAHQDLGNNTLFINYNDDKCVRAASLLDQLMTAGSIMPMKGPFSAEFIEKAQKNELLMFIGASWYGQHVFGGQPDSLYYQTSEHQLGVALSPKWEGEASAWTGAQGGAAWAISRHTKNPELAARLITWLATAPEYMGEKGTTQPAYAANAAIWGAALGTSPLYAFDPWPVMQEAGGLVDPLWNEPIRSGGGRGMWEIVPEGWLEGKTLVDLLPVIQEDAVADAESAAYLVKTAK